MRAKPTGTLSLVTEFSQGVYSSAVIGWTQHLPTYQLSLDAYVTISATTTQLHASPSRHCVAVAVSLSNSPGMKAVVRRHEANNSVPEGCQATMLESKLEAEDCANKHRQESLILVSPPCVNASLESPSLNYTCRLGIHRGAWRYIMVEQKQLAMEVSWLDVE